MTMSWLAEKNATTTATSAVVHGLVRGSLQAAAAGKPRARSANPGPAVPPRLPPPPPAYAPRYREDRADGISPRVIAQEGAMGRARIIVIAAAALVAGIAASPAWAANG